MSRERKEYRYKVSGVRKVRGDLRSDKRKEYRYEVTGPKQGDVAEDVQREFRGAGLGIGGFVRGIAKWFRKIGGGTVTKVKKRVGKRRRGGKEPEHSDAEAEEDEDEESFDIAGNNDYASMSAGRGRPFPSPNV